MEIKKSDLKRIIKEETQKILAENVAEKIKAQLKALADAAMEAGLEFEELVDQIVPYGGRASDVEAGVTRDPVGPLKGVG